MAIAEGLAADVRRGVLGQGDRLPTHRDLAEYLGLTVGTVTRGYAEAERRGLIKGEVGRGTYVAGSGRRWDPLLEPGRSEAQLLDLGLNLPLYAEDPDLAGTLRQIARRRDLDELLRYQPFVGIERHRQAGVRWLARHGLDVDAQQVVITAGAQHAITVLLSTLCRPGDTVLTESLTYPGVKTVASLLNLKLAAVDMDHEGMIPAALDRACGEVRSRVLYCLPTLHNPTTATMSQARRKAIAEVARAHDLLIIEDDVHGLLLPESEAPLANMAPERTFYIASTSKVLAGGLRVAWIAAPESYVKRLAFTMAASMWMAPPLPVEVAALWIKDGTADSVLRRKRREAQKRQELAGQILAGQKIRTDRNAYFLWLELPEPWRADRFTTAARNRGVVITPASAFSIGRAAAPEAIRVSLSAPMTRGETTAGLKVLAELLQSEPEPEAAIV